MTVEDVIDIVSTIIGPDIYNQTIADAHRLFTERASDIETELDLLRQR